MLFEDSYRSLFIFYRIFVIAPSSRFFNLNKTTENHVRKCSEILPSITEHIWIICILAYEFCILIRNFDDLAQNFSLNNLNLYLVFSFIIESLYFIILIIATIESYCQRNVQVQILSNLNEIDRFFETNLNWNINYVRLKRLIQMAFYKWTLFYIISNLILVWFYPYARLLHNLYEMVKEMLIASKYITFAILIKYRIKAMHEVLSHDHKHELRWAHRIFNRNRPINIEATESQRMIDLWHIFGKLYETVQLTNESFKWTISSKFTCDILSACSVLFRLLHYLYGPPDRFYLPEVIAYVVYLVINVIDFGFVVYMAHCVSEEANHLVNEIHRLKSNRAVSEELQNFVCLIYCITQR